MATASALRPMPFSTRHHDCLHCGEVSVFDFILYSLPLKAGKFVKHPHVHYKQTTHIKLESDQPCLIEADGEHLGTLPATVSLAGRQLNFLSGR
ncbi:MAG: hypothetical protein HC859_05970 [Bacteroidia bacterium]|nr:hypothetical protein [Bacteroidia bacterium]